MTSKQAIPLVFCLLALVTYQSCKKGCTDKNALNYMSAAKDNDGTCLYCDSSQQIQYYNYRDIEDENSQSQFAFEDVLFLYLESQAVTYTGNGCQKYNFATTNPSCINVRHDGFLVNLTNATITFSGQLEIEYEQQSTIYYNFNSVLIGPRDTLKIAPFGSICVSPDNDFFDLEFTQAYTLQYQ